MKLVGFVAIMLTLPILGIAGGHYWPDRASLFTGLSFAVSIPVAMLWFQSRKATRR